MKRKISFFASLTVILAILAGGTYAWFSASETANNKMTFGKIDIELISELKASPDKNEDTFVTKVPNIAPGDTFDNRVTIKNVSPGHTAWVRLRLGPVWTGINGDDIDPYESLESFKKAIYPAEYLFNVGDGANQWSFSDGWWYYNSPLKPNEEAEPLFTQVSFSAHGMDNRYMGSSFHITFEGSAVQYENNGDEPGQGWQDASGWPDGIQQR